MRFRIVFAAALCLSIAPAPLCAQIDTAILRPVGYHPNIVAYYNAPYFANALFHGSEWFSFTGSEFGTPVDYNTSQFVNGYPQSLAAGQKLRAIVFGLNINYGFRPAGWPARDTLTKGRVVVTWRGNADIRLVRCTFAAAESSGADTGALADGRRVYLCTGENESTQSIEVHAINTPLTEIRVWLPRPDDPATPAHENETGSLEGELFHPLLLQRIADADWGFIRFMDWGSTNASPLRDWSDRRLPSHAFMAGIINPRAPAANSDGNRETGAAYEFMVALANATGRNLWINVPHLASDDFIMKLAQLIRFGSDGANPYDSPRTNPVFAPLDAGLRVFVEFSNEIWSSGFSFAQGDWAEQEAAARGISKPQFTARRFSDTWRIFQDVFGGTDRLVRVAAIFTGNETYSHAFLSEIASYGATVSVRPDVMAVTTYFGNGIQEFVNERNFAGGRLYGDPYWSSSEFASHQTIAFDEWRRRMLSGDAATGAGPDATGIGGGFPSSLRTLPQETLGYALPIIAYEGGPSLFTDHLDSDAANSDGVPTDDGVTTFVEAMNRDPRIADVYRIHLEIARSKGLWTHTPYTDTSPWSKFGQWGHLETLDQTPAASPKYALLLEHSALYRSLRHVDRPLAAVPEFVTAPLLPPAIVGQPYAADILASGGNGARTAAVIGTFLDSRLSIAQAGETLRISGTPGTSRRNFILARVHDADGDPAWRIFTLETFGGPGTLVQSDFRAPSPALALPWTRTFVLSPQVAWGGWTIGAPQSGDAGVTPREGDNALVFSVSGTTEGNESLAQAMAENEYIRAIVTPATPLDLRGAEIRFAVRRIGFHAPIGYALFTSVGGFAQANAVYVSSELSKEDLGETEHVAVLPATAQYSAVAGPVEIRLYAFGAQFDGHPTSLTAFKLTEAAGGPGRRRAVGR